MCAVIVFLIHQYLLTYVLKVLHMHNKERILLSPCRMLH